MRSQTARKQQRRNSTRVGGGGGGGGHGWLEDGSGLLLLGRRKSLRGAHGQGTQRGGQGGVGGQDGLKEKCAAAAAASVVPSCRASAVRRDGTCVWNREGGSLTVFGSNLLLLTDLQNFTIAAHRLGSTQQHQNMINAGTVWDASNTCSASAVDWCDIQGELISSPAAKRYLSAICESCCHISSSLLLEPPAPAPPLLLPAPPQPLPAAAAAAVKQRC